MTKQERRGAKHLERPSKPARAYKRPVMWYVHYESQGGELLAFAVEGCSGTGERLRGKCRSNICDYTVSSGLKPGARLIKLPSQMSSDISSE